ncbi:universal stress protein [Halobaculum lipolyticum]|uniref:Universal stress protein n=1 Tax=Halobaculum lipolyticum TaxID=3032001 RepID=A0ABD5WE61_9EURY|nr:universal stress protein [Halobaculum sp. DT31]
MPERVLIPYDGTPLAERALRYACGEFPTSDLTALYVVDKARDDTAASGWGDHPSEWTDWLTERRDHAQELFREADAVAAEYDVELGTGVAIGPVADMVIQVAEEYGMDLIVVGAHGQSALGELLIGSVARSLVRRSPVPVTTVRDSPGDDPTADGGD